MQLEGKVALVTGASSGIGKAAALRLAQEGASIGVLGYTEENVQKVLKEIHAKGGQAIPLIVDVSDSGQVKKAVDQLLAEWGRLDIVFANAGINGVWTPVDELEVEEWDKTLNTNLRGTFLTVKYTVPHLKKQGGAIVITSSVNGTRMFSNTGASAYATSKAGQVAFAKMIALELAPSKIRVNVICPGAISTDISDSTEKENLEQVQTPVEFPAGKVPLTKGAPGTPEQVAELVLFLVSNASSHITGTEVWIDGAQSLLQG
jgi:NAD(P)-dependent dehydrogenase (short-subunit alcohol dehydrogenase family)